MADGYSLLQAQRDRLKDAQDKAAYENANNPYQMGFGGKAPLSATSYLQAPNGAPSLPDYQAAYDPSTQSLEKYGQGLFDLSSPNNAGFSKMREEALRTGPSAWAGLAGQKQAMEQSSAEQGASAKGQGQAAQGMSALARSGGLDSGARERMARGAGRDVMNMQTDIGKQGAQNRLQLSMNDEQNRISQLGSLQGMEMDRNKSLGQARQFDIGQAVTEGGRKNDYAMNKYNTQAGIYAGNQMAQATRDAGSGGASWLCTEALPELDKDEWKRLQKLRRYAIKKNRPLAQFYLYECNTLVERMKAMNADWKENVKFVKVIAALIAEGSVSQAYDLYVQVTKGLVEKYWPECSNSAYLEVI